MARQHRHRTERQRDVDVDSDDRCQRHLRRHPNRNPRPVPVAHRYVPQRHQEAKSGTPLALTIRVVNTNNACGAVSGADVEIWHVDAAGDYSQYGSQTAATFLRGIQTTNASGEVSFATIYPRLVSGARDPSTSRW